MQTLTNFSHIKPQRLVGEVKKTLERNNEIVAEMIKSYETPSSQPDWNSTVQILDDGDEKLMEHTFSPVSHLKSVCETLELRKAYSQALPLITAYKTELGQNKRLYAILTRLRETSDAQLDEAQRKQLDNYLLDCQLTGVDLPAAQRKEYQMLLQQLLRLSVRFSENILDATDSWGKIVQEKQLEGVPDPVKRQLHQRAEGQGKKGFLLSLQLPFYIPVISYADNEPVRRDIYTAYITRASDKGKQPKNDDGTLKYDNGALMSQILSLGYRLARMLGYKNGAEMLMVRNMVQSSTEVKSFLIDLAEKAKPRALQEAKELTAFVKEHKKEFQPWDVAYYSEKLRQQKYHFSSEELRDYFIADRVFQGMYKLARRIFGVRFEEVRNFDTWHKDVKLFAMFRDKELLGYLYCDLYARASKQGGAWMNENRQRRRLTNGSLQLPVAYLVCNFRRPLEGNPSLLLHDEVITLFHEFGHCLHHLLTKVECRGVAGIHGVPHDMIELPSQLMENWCWDEGFVHNISCHYMTKKALSSTQLKNLLAARNFQSGLMTLRQVVFSLFDMRLHSEFNAMDFDKNSQLVQQVYDEVSGQLNFLPQAAFNRFPNSFSHIFAGGYAAGYYAYKWAEVMSADIYGAFQQKDIYDNQLARKLRRHIFERGGLGDAMDNFVSVLGRKPDMDAFLRHRGLTK